MTIIVAYHTSDGTWIGSDRQMTVGGVRLLYPDGKFTVGSRWSVAAAGPSVVKDLIEKNRGFLDQDKTPFDIAQAVRGLMLLHGIKPKEEPGDSPDWGVRLVIANGDGAWCADGAQAILKSDFIAEGSGAAWAEGAFHALQGRGMGGSGIVVNCIEAAIRYSTTCGGEPWFQFLPASGADK